MNIDPNTAPPEVMHIDLNSAFAMTEQQANPLIRNRPVGVTNRLNDFSICITASYEAKAYGVGIGTRWREARQMAPGFVMRESDPDKYTHVHHKMKAIFQSYSPVAYMKSIDEGIIDFRGMCGVLKGRSMQDIALEIKQRVKDEVGDHMTINVGIAQNRWLAKVAAEFHKPDGLFTIRSGEQESLFAMLQLTDLPYIKHRMARRMRAVGIDTPVDFYNASYWKLFREVFQSVNGHHWYLKLRGYETEVPVGIRTCGRNYVLDHRTDDPKELSLLFHKAAVKISRRLHKNNLAARGLVLSLRYREPKGFTEDMPTMRWRGRHMWQHPVRRGDQIYERTMELFRSSPQGLVVTHLDLTSYALEPFCSDVKQPSLFQDKETKRQRIEDAINAINDRYGDLVVEPAAVMASRNPMPDKIPFGTVRYLE